MIDDKEFRFLTPIELLELLRKDQKNKGLATTDYRLSKVLGVTPNCIAHTLKHGGSLSDENSIKLADELQLSRAYVVACMARHRIHNPDLKEMWEEIGVNALKNIAFVVLGFSLSFLPFLQNLS